MAYALDNLPSDLPQSLREALDEFREEHGFYPSPRQWLRLFGPDYEPRPENRWMLM